MARWRDGEMAKWALGRAALRADVGGGTQRWQSIAEVAERTQRPKAHRSRQASRPVSGRLRLVSRVASPKSGRRTFIGAASICNDAVFAYTVGPPRSKVMVAMNFIECILAGPRPQVLGYVADWCMLRGEACAFELIQRRERIWFVSIPPYRQVVSGYELRSVDDPRIHYPASPEYYTRVAASPEPLSELIAVTGPGLAEAALARSRDEAVAANAPPGDESRMQAIARRYVAVEYWCQRQRSSGPSRVKGWVGIGAVLGGLGVGAQTLGLNWFIWVGRALLVPWMFGLVYLLFTFTSHGWKAVRTPLAESLVRFDPTIDELREVCKRFRDSAPYVTVAARPRRMQRLVQVARDRASPA